MGLSEEVESRQMRSAQDRFKSRSKLRFWISLTLACSIHIALILVWRPAPEISASASRSGSTGIQALRLVSIQDQPSPLIHRPAPPIPPAPARRVQNREKPIPTRPAPVEYTIDPMVERVVEESIDALQNSAPPPVVVPPLPSPEEGGEEPGLERFRQVTPLMQRPELINRAQVKRALQREYPRALQRRGIEGSVTVWFWIDEEGEVERYEVRGSSGDRELDAAAERVIPKMKFRPAREKGRAIAVVVALPINFRIE